MSEKHRSVSVIVTMQTKSLYVGQLRSWSRKCICGSFTQRRSFGFCYEPHRCPTISFHHVKWWKWNLPQYHSFLVPQPLELLYLTTPLIHSAENWIHPPAASPRPGVLHDWAFHWSPRWGVGLMWETKGRTVWERIEESINRCCFI